MMYEIIRSDRKTLALQVTGEGKVVVRAPRKMPKKLIREFVRQHEDWVLEKLQLWAGKREAFPSCTSEEEAAYRKQAAKVLKEKADHFASQMGVQFGRIAIRGQKTRWGSCSSKGNLNFNWKLMLCPEEIQDYVVVHELAHLKQMNHSTAFYAEVAKVLPDYKKRRDWLKKCGLL